jgi:hypothetical protein
MALSPSLTPARGLPFFSSGVYPKVTPTTIVASVGSGVVTLTPAQLLNGLLLVDCQDAQTLTLPAAAVLNAGLPGVGVGTAVSVDLINMGDSLLTVALGAGLTKPTIAGVSGVLTVATLNAKRFLLVCTSVTLGAEAWVVYAFGSTAAAVA